MDTTMAVPRHQRLKSFNQKEYMYDICLKIKVPIVKKVEKYYYLIISQYSNDFGNHLQKISKLLLNSEKAKTFEPVGLHA